MQKLANIAPAGRFGAQNSILEAQKPNTQGFVYDVEISNPQNGLLNVPPPRGLPLRKTDYWIRFSILNLVIRFT